MQNTLKALVLVSTSTVLSFGVGGRVLADPIDQMPEFWMLTKGIVCKSVEASKQAFDWAGAHPYAERVDLSENPDCIFIEEPIPATLQPTEVYETPVAAVIIAAATPPDGDVRYIWYSIKMNTKQSDT